MVELEAEIRCFWNEGLLTLSQIRSALGYPRAFDIPFGELGKCQCPHAPDGVVFIYWFGHRTAPAASKNLDG